MTTAQIIEVIETILDGRPIIGRVTIDRHRDSFDVIGRVRNFDGCGVQEMLLCSVKHIDMAINVQRTLNFR